MFLGLIDDKGKAIHPHAVTRVAVEIIDWDFFSEGDTIIVSNRTSVKFNVLRNIKCYVGIAFFAEADDSSPVHRPVKLVIKSNSLRKGDIVVLPRRSFQLFTKITVGEFVC